MGSGDPEAPLQPDGALGPLAPWGSAGGHAWVLLTPPCPIPPESGVEPSTVSSLPTWKNTGPNRGCGSKTHTRTRPNAVSCSSGRQLPGPPGRHLAFSPAPPCTCLQGSTPPTALCCRRLPVCPRRPLFRPILPFVPMPWVSVSVSSVCLSEACATTFSVPPQQLSSLSHLLGGGRQVYFLTTRPNPSSAAPPPDLFSAP